jgi:heptosyltransferase-2
LDAPRLTLPSEAQARARERLSALPRPRIALAPGAARGPSKQWPAEHFMSLGRSLSARSGFGIVILGSAGESELGAAVAEGIGPAALNLTGQLGLPEWAATLQACDVAVCNDSGAMHVAAAAGTRVVAL